MPTSSSVAASLTMAARSPDAASPRAVSPDATPDEQRVDARADLELGLQAGQRHEHGAHVALCRVERELAEARRRQHLAHRQAHRAADVVLPAVQRVERDVGRPLHADEDGAIGRGADLARQRGADVGLAIRDCRYRRRVVEAPEALVDAVDEHLAGAPPALLIGDEALHHDERRHRPEPGREIRMGADRLGQRLAEEVRRHDDVVGVAEALQHQVAQARPNRVADQQRTGEHGDRRGHAGDDGQVRPPVVAEAAGDERTRAHRLPAVGVQRLRTGGDGHDERRPGERLDHGRDGGEPQDNPAVGDPPGGKRVDASG